MSTIEIYNATTEIFLRSKNAIYRSFQWSIFVYMCAKCQHWTTKWLRTKKAKRGRILSCVYNEWILSRFNVLFCIIIRFTLSKFPTTEMKCQPTIFRTTTALFYPLSHAPISFKRIQKHIFLPFSVNFSHLALIK